MNTQLTARKDNSAYKIIKEFKTCPQNKDTQKYKGKKKGSSRLIFIKKERKEVHGKKKKNPSIRGHENT